MGMPKSSGERHSHPLCGFSYFALLAAAGVYQMGDE
jgi:hypothetical protein